MVYNIKRRNGVISGLFQYLLMDCWLPIESRVKAIRWHYCPLFESTDQQIFFSALTSCFSKLIFLFAFFRHFSTTVPVTRGKRVSNRY
ncbi:MAG: hypothetical protein ACFFD4_12005 [Candidatus Odinarchaeota archaeon]